MFDTICAISTPIGEGGISIIRVSGNKALEVLNIIFKKKKGELKNFSLNYGYIFENENIIDEVLVGIMKSPNSYTKEDVVEINCHGGFLVTQKIFELLLKKGIREAEPGEFTKRAFMNGRIDLSQAESIIDIIKSKTDNCIKVSLDHLRGDIKEKILFLKKLLFDVSAHVNVVIDYPEEGIEEPLPENLFNNIIEVKSEIENLIKTYDKGKRIKNGIKASIVGKPNSGKSTLLNCLLKEERAIVTHIPGTTRDVIEEIININGIPMVLADTAGIRETEDIIENIGVKKTKESIDKSDLILFVIDGSNKIDYADIDIYNRIRNKKAIGIINKNDKNLKISDMDLEKLSNIKRWSKISAINGTGIEEMEKNIYNEIVSKEIESLSQSLIITNIRHKNALENSLESIDNIIISLENHIPLDLIAIDLKESLDYLSEITGEITNEDILDHIFSNFCVGK